MRQIVCAAPSRSAAARTFYRGWSALFVRDCFGYALLYSTFETTRKSQTIPVWMCGGLSGLSFYIGTLPVDRVKTIMMTESCCGGKHECNALRCFIDIMQR